MLERERERKGAGRGRAREGEGKREKKERNRRKRKKAHRINLCLLPKRWRTGREVWSESPLRDFMMHFTLHLAIRLSNNHANSIFFFFCGGVVVFEHKG